MNVHRTGTAAERPRVLPRRRLVSRVSEPGTRIVILSAPAGYGKTTLLQQVAGSSSVPVALISLDEAANDPRLLRSHVADALRASRALGAIERTPERVRMEDLVRELRGVSMIIALDELQTVHEPSALAELDVLIRSAPPSVRFVLAARGLPQLKLAKLRSTGDAAELTREEMSMSEAEAARMLSESGTSLAPNVARRVWEKLEGWPAALQLVRAAMDAGGEPTAVVEEALSGSGDIAEYLVEEVVSQQAEPVRCFLLETSILERLRPDVCDWIREADDSAALIDSLEDARLLFLISDTQEARHFLGIFRDVLLAELDRGGASRRRRLHHRAAEWYHQHDDPAAEFEHRLRSDERTRAASVISTHSMRLLTSGNRGLVESWLDRFSAAEIAASAPLALATAWTAVFRADLPTALRHADLAEQATWEGPLPDGTASAAGAVAILRSAVCVGSLDEAAAHAMTAVELEPRESPWRPSAHLQLGTITLIAGDPAAAQPHLEQAAMLAGDHQPAVRLSALGYLALIHSQRGARESAIAAAIELDRAILTEGLDRFPPMAFPYAISGSVLATGRRLPAAERLLLRSLDLLEQIAFIFPPADAWIRTLICEAWLAVGDEQRARDSLADARSLLERHPLDPRVERSVSRLERLLDPAARLFEPLTERELEILQMLSAVQSLNQIAAQLVISVNTVKTHVSSIYRKLGAMNRHDAVQRARGLGLLPE